MGGFRLLREVESELDDIWVYTALGSSSLEIANRLVDTITERFWLLAQHPQIGRRRDADLRPGLRSFTVGGSSSTASKGKIYILHVMRGSRDIAGLLGE